MDEAPRSRVGLPDELFDLIPSDHVIEKVDWNDGTWIAFRTDQDALHALAAACLAFIKSSR